jgi:hypothetical protein
LDQAFLFERTIDIDTYDRHRDELREELTLVQMERHSSELEEMDVEGILAFAGVLSGRDSFRREKACWNRRNPAGFQLLEPDFGREKDLVDLTGIEPVTS